MSQHAQPSRRTVRIALGGVAVGFMVVAICAGIRVWLTTPKIKVADVENQIGKSLPSGTPAKEVEAWLDHRSMPYRVIRDEANGNQIQSWISDSGPRAEWPYGIRDISLVFIFDKNERLIEFRANEEDRF